MKKYLVVKVIEAEPQTSTENNKETGQFTPNELEGYKLVHDGGKYQSWCPKDMFEKSYRPIGNLTFGLAVECLKMGKRVRRKVWDDSMKYLSLFSGYGVDNNMPDYSRSQHFIGLKSYDNPSVKWKIHQTDVLAEDWVILE